MPSRHNNAGDEEAPDSGSITDVETTSINSCNYGTFAPVPKPKQPKDVARVPKPKPTYMSILTPHVVSLLISTTGLVIASETLFSL